MLIGIDASRAFTFPRAGPENYSYYLIRALLGLKTHHRFRLYLNLRNLSNLSNLGNLGPETRTIAWPYLWTQGGLAWECLRNPPDVLFVPAHTLPLLRLSRLKTVVTIHDLGAQFLPNYYKFPQRYYLNFATSYAIKNATKIIAVSNYTKEDILRNFKVQSSKCQVIYEGYEKTVYFPQGQQEVERVKEKYAVKGNYFYFQSTIQPRKNLLRLIEAFAKLLVALKGDALSISRHPLEEGALSLVIAGKPGWLYEEIYQAPRRFAVEDRVKFLGYVDSEKDCACLMSGALAYVHPTLFEGFSITILEALACGVPVITSRVTSVPEVGGEAVLYVDPYSVGEIANKMLSVISYQLTERQRIIEKGLEQANKFSWEKAAQETLAFLESADI